MPNCLGSEALGEVNKWGGGRNKGGGVEKCFGIEDSTAMRLSVFSNKTSMPVGR